MGHANRDFLGALLGSGFNHCLNGRDGGFAAFQTEALGAHEFPRTKGFKALGFRKLL